MGCEAKTTIDLLMKDISYIVQIHACALHIKRLKHFYDHLFYR